MQTIKWDKNTIQYSYKTNGSWEFVCLSAVIHLLRGPNTNNVDRWGGGIFSKCLRLSTWETGSRRLVYLYVDKFGLYIFLFRLFDFFLNFFKLKLPILFLLTRVWSKIFWTQAVRGWGYKILSTLFVYGPFCDPQNIFWVWIIRIYIKNFY